MRGKALIVFATGAATLVLTAACGGGGADITVERGLKVSAGLPVEAGVAESFAAGGGGAPAFAAPAEGEAFTLFQQGVASGITGQGFGSATVAADSATLQIFAERFEEPIPAPAPFDGEPFEEPFRGEFPEQEPFTEADLAPIVDALVDRGVPRGDIEVVIHAEGGKFGPTTAQVRATVRDPEGKLESLVEAAGDAANSIPGVSFFDTTVLYAVDDCAPLEREALRAAIEDATERAQLLADTLDRTLGDLVFASESFFSPFAPSPCDPSALGFEEFEFFGGMPFDPSQPAEVELVSSASLTFAFE